MPKKVLIIDDDIDLVEAMRITLENAGFEVIDAQDGLKGLEKARDEKPDLIILDVMMGTQDEGFHVAYQMRQDAELQGIPIIMLTAVGQETGFKFDKDKDEDFLPVDEFIEKPVDPQKLIEKVKVNLGM
ncbi:MAG TPA: response regulator [Caldithrix abyssi]|uniref:Response regulator n=1 Tax=Caldithrix abyssi TaxID=187145 RepID=A0A7V5H278_CALAY|nr:response regulator [Caldisericaceae bacterium]HHE54322.1 response regulator [Caldithrix abyssi]